MHKFTTLNIIYKWIFLTFAVIDQAAKCASGAVTL